VVLSAFALTPIDSMALEYQLSDLNFVVRLALLRFDWFDFFSFCLSWPDVLELIRTFVRTKHPPFAHQSAPLLSKRRIVTNRIVRREIEGQSAKTPKGAPFYVRFGG
jgi:hypothetical protein